MVLLHFVFDWLMGLNYQLFYYSVFVLQMFEVFVCYLALILNFSVVFSEDLGLVLTNNNKKKNLNFISLPYVNINSTLPY
jgi:hypothetical protein